ncbi:uncharacterized protein LOC113345291 isoform X2 [Papaver somniferum]|uniref:uncharacterized protein LOC113345291 isoform X2 n=1 Tax=Papaver somniferum TaxID=3469 RepID=UPI000E6F8814|nr:uncharacterized protein LOC113345291 isoform X2 [Papaver somniferum]XP_026444862.1 uncharacterized protein LOC113345291 isoform X2 [Papaver somniferum]
MENRPIEISSSPRFIWRIDNFSKLDAKLIHRELPKMLGLSEQQKIQPAVPAEVVKHTMENGAAKVQEEPVKKKVKQESCLDYILLLVVDANPEAQVAMQYQRAGKLFEFGQSHHVKGIALDGEKFEDVGGFSVLKSQASLYKNIWLKYGHIASSQVLTASSYMGQVWLVADIMSSIVEMTDFRFVDMSSEVIELWENKIKMAEALEFNIKWLRERLEDVKKCFKGIQKCKNALQEQVQPLKAAKVQVIAAANELKKAQSRLIAAEDKLRENISSLVKRTRPFSVSESDIGMYLEKGDTLILDGIF